MSPKTAGAALHAYQSKRNFAITPEPRDGGATPGGRLAFVVQKHWASSLHFDFRLEWGGSLKSWAVPKGPSLDPRHKRMAVEVEDHPVAYAGFEGVIPTGQYGAGRVIVWDRGFWQPLGDPADGLRQGHLKFELVGQKLRGRWALVRMKSGVGAQRAWLLLKEKDGFARAAAAASALDALPAQAVPARLPARLQPALATLADRAPADPSAWVYEIKFDGYRLLARLEGSRVALFTRNGHDWTVRLPGLSAALKALHLPPGWYDGEIVVANPEGLPDFSALQQSFESGRTQDVVFHVFDLPFVAGHDLRAVPLQARRALLEGLLEQAGSEHVRFSQAFEVDGASVMQAACRLGLEGVIGKRRLSPYTSSRSADWIKLKCGHRQEFVICGFTEPRGARRGIGALLLGVHGPDGGLRYVGDVGTGFSDAQLLALRKTLDGLVLGTHPFAAAPAVPGRPHWVDPRLLAEVSFAGWTRAGRVRHAVFCGLRSDKPAQAVVREQPAPAGGPGRPVLKLPRGLSLSHPERVIDPHSGVRKCDLVAYYQQVGAMMMRHLAERPLAWLRAPTGIGGAVFFQKHAQTAKLPGVRQLSPAMLQLLDGGGLLQAAQWNVIEFHTSNQTTRQPVHPDRMIFDLDPGAGVPWPLVQEAAELMRVFLAQLGLAAFLKTSGGKGLHVVVPLRLVHEVATVKGFSQAIVQHLAREIPERFVATSGPSKRVGRIFIDYLRNGAGATTVAAWSARARPGMGISVPVAWEELPMLSGGDQWTVATADERLAAANAPWAGYERSARSLHTAMHALSYTELPDPVATAPPIPPAPGRD